VLTLWKARRDGGGIRLEVPEENPPKYAFLGVRACELSAIAVQDRVFLEGPYIDRAYAERRERAFLIAVNCGQAASTCFCTSMSTGPRAQGGFDLALTELPNPERHLFVVEVGTERGAEILAGLGCEPATRAEIDEAAEIVERTAASMGRTLDVDGVRELLQGNLEHPRWDHVAERCFSCANCTMVCPTCFCSTVEDTTDLSGAQAQRRRRWDSCFTLDFSYLGGLPARASTKSRYRQWLTHKLSTWYDQFESSGCVGCGRCITWCPVGIDLTHEVDAIRTDDRREKEATA
jgi:ferredoxin